MQIIYRAKGQNKPVNWKNKPSQWIKHNGERTCHCTIASGPQLHFYLISRQKCSLNGWDFSVPRATSACKNKIHHPSLQTHSRAHGDNISNERCLPLSPFLWHSFHVSFGSILESRCAASARFASTSWRLRTLFLMISGALLSSHALTRAIKRNFSQTSSETRGNG